MVYTFNPSIPAWSTWSTEWLPEQPGLLHRKPCLKKRKQKPQKISGSKNKTLMDILYAYMCTHFLLCCKSQSQTWSWYGKRKSITLSDTVQYRSYALCLLFPLFGCFRFLDHKQELVCVLVNNLSSAASALLFSAPAALAPERVEIGIRSYYHFI